MGYTPRDSSFKRRFYARCAWEGCTYVGALRKGLCDTHYAALGRELVREGIVRSPGRYRDGEGPLNCRCPEPQPESPKIINKHVVVANTQQCGRCGRWVQPVEQ